MKRIFLLKGLDCPNCSAKIEKEVGELDGVQSSVVNLMKQTLTTTTVLTIPHDGGGGYHGGTESP